MLLHELLLLRVFFYFFIFFIVAGNQRRRRRKKKNKDGEPDSQEEGKPDQEKVELHFEDVEEFPVLSSAKVSNNMATGKSYSAAVQETVSHYLTCFLRKFGVGWVYGV